jgi:hypothetical protein
MMNEYVRHLLCRYHAVISHLGPYARPWHYSSSVYLCAVMCGVWVRTAEQTLRLRQSFTAVDLSFPNPHST